MLQNGTHCLFFIDEYSVAAVLVLNPPLAIVKINFCMDTTYILRWDVDITVRMAAQGRNAGEARDRNLGVACVQAMQPKGWGRDIRFSHSDCNTRPSFDAFSGALPETLSCVICSGCKII